MSFDSNSMNNSVFRPDRAHDGKPEHGNLTQKLPGIAGADSVEVDQYGNVISGFTQIGKIKMPWEK